MAKFVMEINLDNAVFGDDPRSEIQYLMEKVTQETASCVRIDFQYWTYGVPTQKPIAVIRDLVGEELEQAERTRTNNEML